MKNPLDYVRPNILALEPYSTARDEFKGGDISVWIDANENPFDNGVNRYPDPHQRALKSVVARLKGVAEECLFIGGAGSDEAIDLTYRIFCTPGKDNAIAIAPSYGVYKVAADINDVELRPVLLDDGFALPTRRLLAAADSQSKLLWICSPNNPTGNAFNRDDIVGLADRFDGMVVVDEAYIDFTPGSSVVGEIAAHPNIIVLQTLSKAWGMAALRLGMAIADPRVAELFARIKYPYNVNGPTQAEVIRRIGRADLAATVSTILAERAKLAEALAKLPCVVKVYPSDANFLLVKMTDAGAVYDHLIAHGIIARNRSTQPLCESTLRLTVGTPSENIRLIDALSAFPTQPKLQS